MPFASGMARNMRSPYSGSLRTGRSGVRIPLKAILSQPSRPALRSTKPPVQGVPALFSGDKAAGAWRWLHNPHQMLGLKEEQRNTLLTLSTFMAFSREKVKLDLLHRSKYFAINIMKYKSSVTYLDAPNVDDTASAPVSIHSHVSGARRKLNHISSFVWVIVI
jgi:hypothetical protein